MSRREDFQRSRAMRRVLPDFLRSHPDMSTRQVAEHFGVSKAAAWRAIAKLQKNTAATATDTRGRPDVKIDGAKRTKVSSAQTLTSEDDEPVVFENVKSPFMPKRTR